MRFEIRGSGQHGIMGNACSIGPTPPYSLDQVSGLVIVVRRGFSLLAATKLMQTKGGCQ